MAYFEKVISGFEVGVDTDMNGDGDQSAERVTGCWINKGDLSGSLELLLSLGGLEDKSCNVVELPDALISRIESWAHSVGY